MGINPTEIQQNQQRTAVGIAPVPYSLISQQTTGKTSSTKKPDIDFKPFDSYKYKEEGFDKATRDFYQNDVRALKEQETVFWAKWEGVFKDFYGGNESAFISEMIPFIERDIQSIYQHKGIVEQKEGQLKRNWERANSDAWKKVDDDELLVKGDGTFYNRTELIGQESVNDLIGMGATKEMLEAPLTKRSYMDMLHSLPADQYEVLDYVRPDTEFYYKTKLEFISKNVGKIESLDEDGNSVTTNASNLNFALEQWDEYVSADPKLSRVHNMIYNDYQLRAKHGFDKISDADKTKMNLKREKIVDYEAIGWENMSIEQKEFYNKNYEDVIAYDYSGAGGLTSFKNTTSRLRGVWEAKTRDRDYGSILESYISAVNPNAANIDEISTSTIDKAWRRQYDGLSHYTDVTTGAILESAMSLDVDNYEAYDRSTIDDDRHNGTNFADVGGNITAAGGIQKLSEDTKLDSDTFWRNVNHYDPNYLQRRYSREINNLVDKGEFSVDGKKYKLIENTFDDVNPGLYGGMIDKELPETYYTVINEDGKQTNFRTGEMLDLALTDIEKKKVGAVDYMVQFGIDTDLINSDESMAIAINKDNSYKKFIEHMEYIQFSAYSLSGSGKFIPGHLENASPAYQVYDFRDKTTHPIRIHGLMIHGDEMLVGLDDKNRYITSTTMVTPETAESYIIKRHGERSHTSADQEYPTLEEWLVSHPASAVNVYKALGISIATTEGQTRLKGFLKHFMIDQPVLITNAMFQQGSAEEKDYKQKIYSPQEEEGDYYTPLKRKDAR